jgi:hypothetical protein
VNEIHYDPESSQILAATEFSCSVLRIGHDQSIGGPSMNSHKFEAPIGGIGQLKYGSQIVVSFPVEKTM